ncbi:hypothetical protein CCMSSC00406_0004249 [Pleurotus cornucopiae]|uniref:Uncharacterized protein n=1 Tax=Pleurotus cornucopiae TaxID=5321 RepID=A0ACB7J9E8_PLECO|nr:hypothetical protein CCMSSC00406_0004249 [Pleurotus cornucopiae]
MLSGVLSSSPMLNLAAATGSFPFPTKFIALPPDAKVTLGLEQPAATSSRKAENMNGWFPHKQPSASGSNPIAPLPLSTAHAEVWSQGGKVSEYSISKLIANNIPGVLYLFLTKNDPR